MQSAKSRLRRGVILVTLALLLAGPVAAEDDDDGPGGGSPGGAPGGGSPGGGPGAGQGGEGAQHGFDLGPRPGTNPIRDAGRVFEALFGGLRLSPAAPAPAPRPQAPVELVASGLTPAALDRARAEGFVVLAERPLAGGLRLARLRAPARLGAQAAAARLRVLASGAVVDRNALFRLTGVSAPSGLAVPAAPPAATPCAEPVTVALVDTAVDPRHPILANVELERETLRGPGRRPSRPGHGTAVAVRLAAELPGARLVAIDAFHLGPDGEAADAFDLAAALDRIAALGAAVANLSFAGPSNAVIDAAGAAAARQGTVLVAAAGNDGPRAPPRYPAAHPWAVAVTAVDAEGRAWPRAAAGPHVAFAAHGVEVLLPSLPGSPARRWSGTSFAAPLVTAALAAEASVGRRQDAGLAALAAAARDLGRPGRDPVFGWGLVAPGRCAPPPPAEPVAR